MVLGVATAAQAQISTSAWYSAVNKNSNKCVDAAASGTANGTVIQQYTCNGTNAQNWQFTATSGGYYKIATRNNTGQVWDVSGVSTADGAKLNLWAYGGGNNQQWLPVAEANGYYHFIARHSGKCLDVPGASTGDSVQLQQYTCNNSAAQSFQLANANVLHARNRTVVNGSGNVVQLNGFNLGSWLTFEKWMSPMDSGSIADHYGVIQTLDNRFGVATEQSLIRGFQDNWITTADLDNIHNAGHNCVRVPVWYGDFYVISNVSNSGWRSDAFAKLDWLVSNAASRGIYVIIDMHGVVGGQSTDVVTGRGGQNLYWSDGNNQGNTAWMWWQIASHFKGNTTVAGYDLMNEPMGTPSSSALWTAYNSLYQTIRGVDPDHMIIMEGTYGSWNWSMLPPPSQYGWTNVMYQMHEYQWNGTEAQVRTGAANQVTDFNNHASWNVPGYIGEFNDFGYPTATWAYTRDTWNAAGLSWTMWAYKATHGLNPDSWGWYSPTSWKQTPNIATDSAATIAADWAQWQTTATFARNTIIPF
jgi:aryl-phospho-beta-D-glucosidase BglC (GH1 family)